MQNTHVLHMNPLRILLMFDISGIHYNLIAIDGTLATQNSFNIF